MAVDHDKPFRFLDLPLEIQRNIFSKYYEEPWEVRHKCKLYSQRGEPPLYSFSLSRNILLVNHHFHLEARLAIRESRGNTYYDRPFPYRPVPDGWFDPAIATVNSPMLASKVANYRKRFTNLKAIQLGDLDTLIDNAEQVFHGKDLWDVVRGNHNHDISGHVRRLVMCALKKDLQPEDLDGMILTTFVETRWLDVALGIGIKHNRQHVLCFNIDITHNGACVSSKKICHYNSSYLAPRELDATEANLRMLCQS
ncbi:hypothetical protein OHC33_000184 [Knufia fluminis]|uniref:Uncharacterized protein n=1 Tax=Knufia fluminis TaxID=191047 RepID=A0AAN8ISM3_9EURO|nr:hypothetical protein OHC33_000184 [Knufia fluminis]